MDGLARNNLEKRRKMFLSTESIHLEYPFLFSKYCILILVCY